MRPDETESVYEGTLIRVVAERWGDHRREIVEHAGSVAIVPVEGDGRVVLVRQLREPTRGMLLELPAGVVEEGEEPLDAARRELREETGLTGGRWRELAAFWTSPGFLRERMHLYLAEEVEPGEADPRDDEDVELVRIPFDEAVRNAAELEDAKTIAGLLLAAAART
ncbi:MAG: NUDIX hydrolase [Pseudomonadota bacterium]